MSAAAFSQQPAPGLGRHTRPIASLYFEFIASFAPPRCTTPDLSAKSGLDSAKLFLIRSSSSSNDGSVDS